MFLRVCFGVLAGSATISSAWEIKGSLDCCMSHFLRCWEEGWLSLAGAAGTTCSDGSRDLSRWLVVLASLADWLRFHASSQAISSAKRAVWAGNVTFRTK